jgi:hypothetical protein
MTEPALDILASGPLVDVLLTDHIMAGDERRRPVL